MAKANAMKPDDENPEWTAADFARAKPARDMLPAGVFEALTKKRGRPPKADAKQQVTLRLGPDLLEAFKASGPGWQTRIEDTLRAAVAAGTAAGLTGSKQVRRKESKKQSTKLPSKRAAATGRAGRA